MNHLLSLLVIFGLVLTGCTNKNEETKNQGDPRGQVVSSFSATVVSYYINPQSIKKGERVLLQIMANMSDGTVKSMDQMNWSYEYDGEKMVTGDSNNGVLKIEQIDKKTAYITGLKQGEVLIHVTLAATSGANGKTIDQVIKVKNPISIPVNSGAEQISENVYQYHVNQSTINYQVNLPASLSGKVAEFKYTYELSPGIAPLQAYLDGSTSGEHTEGGIDTTIVKTDGTAKPDFNDALIDSTAKKYLNLKNAAGQYVYQKMLVDVVVDGDQIKLVMVR